QPDAAVRAGLVDEARLGGTVDAVGGLAQVDPHGADRAVGARRNGENLGVVALLEVDLGVVGIVGHGGDALDDVGAGGRGIVLAADGRRIGGDEPAIGIVGAHLA